MTEPLGNSVKRIGGASIAANLRQAGNAWPDEVPIRVTWQDSSKHIIRRHGMGPGPDKGHIPFHYVEELRQFLQTRVAQEPAEARQDLVSEFC